jgi:hypothetical protein
VASAFAIKSRYAAEVQNAVVAANEAQIEVEKVRETLSSTEQSIEAIRNEIQELRAKLQDRRNQREISVESIRKELLCYSQIAGIEFIPKGQGRIRVTLRISGLPRPAVLDLRLDQSSNLMSFSQDGHGNREVAVHSSNFPKSSDMNDFIDATSPPSVMVESSWPSIPLDDALQELRITNDFFRFLRVARAEFVRYSMASSLISTSGQAVLTSTSSRRNTFSATGS